MNHPLSVFKFCPKCGSVGFVENDPRSKCCKNCGFTFYLNAATAVSALILNEKGEMLMCRRAFEPYKGTLDMPGGFAEFDETAEEALKREVREEVCAEVVEMQYFMSAPNQYPYSDMVVRTLDLAFFCKVKTFDGLKACDDASEILFLPLAELDISAIHLKSLRLFAERAKELYVKSGFKWPPLP